MNTADLQAIRERYADNWLTATRDGKKYSISADINTLLAEMEHLQATVAEERRLQSNHGYEWNRTVNHLQEPMSCGHPHACLEACLDDDGEHDRCTACERQEKAVYAEQLRVLKLAEQGACVVHGGELKVVNCREIGIVTVYGGSVNFESPLSPVADPCVTVRTINVQPDGSLMDPFKVIATEDTLP